MTPAEVAARQLGRMRGMTALYHRRFFADTRFTMLVVLALFVAGKAVDPLLYLLLAPVALLGAAQTAFDASYLIFARHYAARLEAFINQQLGVTVLVAAELEEAYLFPLHRRKIVTLAFGDGFSWFGFMTLLYTAMGVAVYAVGMALSLDALAGDTGTRVLYGSAMAGVTLLTLAIGVWWFVGGEGERRLRAVLDRRLG